jgi:hypothetical protein
MSDVSGNETEAAAPAAETLAITLASGLVARYRALVDAGLYVSIDEAIGDAMRGHVRDAIDAAHHVVTLRLEPNPAETREAAGGDAGLGRSGSADR